ncbi:MAG: TonB-dependent receptor plug domain-containing protein, partial [Bacteroidota bacterium]|nr:TonB-dependent receptor plug domain-containing protein [Bacteroidota bacterium]
MKKSYFCNGNLRAVLFRRWGGKKYSAFASLRVIVNIGVLLVSYQVSANPGMNLEHPDTTDVKRRYSLEAVQVSAQRAPVTYSQVARIVSVIERSEIEAAPVQSINELLKYLLNVDIRQRGQFGVQADVSIRGGSSDQTLILLNGININDPQTGHFNLDLPVSLESIQRIEILEGPASRVFGPNAFSGAINIITGTDLQNRVKLSA